MPSPPDHFLIVMKQSTQYLKGILILSYDVCVGFLSFFPPRVSWRNVFTYLWSHPCMLHCPTHHIIFDFVIPDNNDEKYKILELFTIQFPSSSCVLECPDVLLRITSQTDRQTDRQFSCCWQTVRCACGSVISQFNSLTHIHCSVALWLHLFVSSNKTCL